jgi:peptidoglycan/xylan/chitin deacetylase (PgdA/CDA1 family)
LRAPNGHSVFLDPGHGGIDPGAAGVTRRGRPILEKQLTLAIALKTLRLLRGDGFRVVISRTTDTTVSRLGRGQRRGGALTVAADQRELRARIRCANATGAQVLLGIHLDSSSDRFVGGAETIYSPARSFSAASLRLAKLVQQAVVARLRAAGWRIPDRGVKSDAGQGRAALSEWERRYRHLLELGPARPPRFRDPTRMPGVIVEPLFISDPVQVSIAASTAGQWDIAGALATAVESYFGVHKPPRASALDLLQGKPPRALIGRIPTTFPTRKRLIALTFDAGANDAGMPRIAATLKRLGVPATFFMTGHFARFYPAWARRIAASYVVGNHTMNHVDLNPLSDAQVRAEVLDAQRTIRRITGRPPQPLFRFPYGDESRRTLRIVNSLGYAAVGWTADTAGWLGPSGGQSTGTVVRRALAALRPGAILLMHVGSNPNDGSTLDARALPAIIRAIERRGYAFTTLSQAYALAYPRWAAAGRHAQPRRLAVRLASAPIERFVRRGLPLYCGGSRTGYVALTFDDGPGPATAMALRLLRRFRERATFFLVGRNLAEWPRLPRAELTLGAVGDHTWTHPFLTRLPRPEVDVEIARTQQALARATGAPVQLFRPPYGFHDVAVDREVRRLGMLEVLWSLDSRDSYPPPGASADEIVRTLARSLRSGSIVLMHENLRQTELALPAILRWLRAAHLRSVGVQQLLALDPPSLAQLRAGIHGCPGANA